MHVAPFPSVWISAKTGQRTLKLRDRIDEVRAAGAIRVATPELNRWLQEVAGPAVSTRTPGGNLRLYYATQTGVHPPSFVLFCNDPSRVHFSFRRYLENTLRDRFGFGAAPLRLQFRRRRESRAR